MDKFFALRDAPLWLLLGLASAAALVWKTPSLQAGIPTAITSMLPLTAISLGMVGGFRGLSRAIQFWKSHREQIGKRNHERLLKVYRPLETLFLERHVSACSAVLAPRLRHRLNNARSKMREHGRLLHRLSRAGRALQDREVHTSAEVEYGGEFPLREIKVIARENMEHADDNLRMLIRQADRSKYEEPHNRLLTAEEFALFNYIHAEHDRLSKRT